MDQNPSEILHRIMILERRSGDLESAFNEQGQRVQEIVENTATKPVLTHDNIIRNGEIDISRNNYLYSYDITGTPGVDADVSEEAAFWFVSEPDTAVESTGSITAADNTLELDTTDFIVGDVGVEIVVEGAGTAGADLVTTIATFTDSDTVELTNAAATTVTSARVRWRLMTLVEDTTDTDSDADPATNTTLKTADHTLFGSTLNDPYWDRANGWAVLASTNWLCQPLKQNVIRPAVPYFNSFVSSLSEGEERINFFAGIWDNSPGRKCFLEGGPITVTATVYGSPGATTSRDYMLVFYTNWGQSIGSEIVTVAGAPTTFSATEYVGLEWDMPAGIIRVDIFRKTGSTYVKLNPPYPAESYQDKGSVYDDTPIGWPEVDGTRARAYIETNQFNVPLSNTNWQTMQLSIPVPSDYDASLTTDMQWYVFGILAAPGAGEMHVDRFSLDDKPGIFSRSSADAEAKRNVSTAPVGGTFGGYGGAGGIDPGDTGYCVCLDTLVEIEDTNGDRYEIPAVELVDNQRKYKIVNMDGFADDYEADISPERQVCYELKAGQFSKLRASAQHPVFVNETETFPLQQLTMHNKIVGKDGILDVVSNLRLPDKLYVVRISLKGKQKGYIAGGIFCHNNKPGDPGLN